MKFCNICCCSEFFDFNKRHNVLCSACKSLERHRVVRWGLEQLGYLDIPATYGKKRALHLAPEEMTHRYLIKSFAAGYICADLKPENYPHAKCMKLQLPEGFDFFPECYFDLILHNHVLEHIPGDYRDHLNSFLNLLKPGGHLVFTIPGISNKALTIQGGEHLSNDFERIRLHGQADHFKTFGYDLMDWFKKMPGEFAPMEIAAETRSRINAPSESLFVYTKI